MHEVNIENKLLDFFFPFLNQCLSVEWKNIFSAFRRVRRKTFTLLISTTYIVKKIYAKKWLLSSTGEIAIPAPFNLWNCLNSTRTPQCQGSKSDALVYLCLISPIMHMLPLSWYLQPVLVVAMTIQIKSDRSDNWLMFWELTYLVKISWELIITFWA